MQQALSLTAAIPSREPICTVTGAGGAVQCPSILTDEGAPSWHTFHCNV